MEPWGTLLFSMCILDLLPEISTYWKRFAKEIFNQRWDMPLKPIKNNLSSKILRSRELNAFEVSI